MDRLPYKFLLLIILSFFSCNPAHYSRIDALSSPLNSLRIDINYLINDPKLQNANIGIYIQSLSDQKILYVRNEYKLFIPASNLKLFTTATALSQLGPNFRFNTEILKNGTVSDDTLFGNLIVRGGGDPTFSGRFHNGATLGCFSDWTDSLRQKGIRVISGKIIGDDSFFSGPSLAEGWDWDDLPFWYAAESGALSLNDNCVDITLTPADSIGLPVRVNVDPLVDGIQIINNSITVAQDSLSTLSITRTMGKNEIVINGEYPLSKRTIRRSITVSNPTAYFLSGAKQGLANSGIEILQQDLIIKDDPTSLFRYHSVKLPQIIKVVNKKSHNFYAEQLLKSIGADFYGNGSFKSGCREVMRWAASIGIDNDELIMVDGSGLSRKNYITPRATARLLEYMSAQKQFLHYYNSLPISTIDGTLKNRMVGSIAAKHVHAKTGYLSHVRNLSGYLRGKDGKLYLFVILVNNYSVPTPYINNLQDRICSLLYNYSSASTK